MTNRKFALLHHRITQWYAASARELPWRAPDASPWSILVSEFMLQQTPVVRVQPVWEQWMQRWPEAADLAAEPASEVVRAWGRLGYPRRALRLHATAQHIVELHGGQVPRTEKELLALPGVGTYTAAAVASFAFGIPATVVDTNIRRVHARLVKGCALPEPSYTAKEAALAERLMPAHPADPEELHPLANAWNISVMELGALICTARNPRCGDCPVQDLCAWVAAGRPAPHYVPKGQAWAGTDRQVRGSMMAVLRHTPGPVGRTALVGGIDLLRPLSDMQLELGSETGSEAHEAWVVLYALAADAEQRERCLAGLIGDGLARETTAGVGLPA
ncbi:A/G-specific adenine glycosylase [Paeniglutamicibacter cryotolerans]|uniref:Adenine DNA glycosylase n=1 Tax=Paeniglutamicibacter cryotolerans TaxID=670079 RepID=A0A839QFH9_9MICC|nr:A/G-specific adenine glycosylase [Paeniglutamicibacter cryotolerans]MBB2995038.1 A/G-specific adenine glycosylase [Paeniglutamicibacter cryotolerans]